MHFDVVIIGAGQQGLALGQRLQKRNVSFVILEQDLEVGARWKRHYDSLVLFTPRRYSALPELPLRGAQDTYATKDEFASYLAQYAKAFNLPIHISTSVTRLTKTGDIFTLQTTKGNCTATQVVVATGYPVPVLPTYRGNTPLHSSQYKNPHDVPGKDVLVVGNGNSAVQIALELKNIRTVSLAMKEIPHTIPRKILGKSFYWWRDILGLNHIPTHTLFGKLFALKKDFVVGREILRALKDKEITLVPEVQSIENSTVTFSDGSIRIYDHIVCATGFTQEYSWIDIPNALKETQGVSEVHGLFFAGIRNQLTAVSSNIYGVTQVSDFLMKKLTL